MLWILIRIQIRIRSGFKCVAGSISGSGFAIRIRIQEGKKVKLNFIFWSAGCSLLRDEGFSCNLDISKVQFLIKKDFKKFLLYFFFFNVWSSKPWIRIVSGFVSRSGFNVSGSTALLEGNLIHCQPDERTRTVEDGTNCIKKTITPFVHSKVLFGTTVEKGSMHQTGFALKPLRDRNTGFTCYIIKNGSWPRNMSCLCAPRARLLRIINMQNDEYDARNRDQTRAHNDDIVRKLIRQWEASILLLHHRSQILSDLQSCRWRENIPQRVTDQTARQTESQIGK